jgi:DNA-binding MarR family transcriptional regulator
MTRWLSEDEQASWRATIAMMLLLPDRLGRELTKNHGLSLPDFEILVKLSEAPEAQMRMSHLADKTLASRSRLSHACDRLEKSGFITRQACEADGRGYWAVLTDFGWEKLNSAAADHVESVRSHLVDLLTPNEFAELGRIALKVSEHLKKIDDTSND